MASYFAGNSVMETTVKTIMRMLATCYSCPQKPLCTIHDENFIDFTFIRETTGSVGTPTCFRTPWTWVWWTNCGTSCDVMAAMAAASFTLHTVCVMMWKKKNRKELRKECTKGGADLYCVLSARYLRSLAITACSSMQTEMVGTNRLQDFLKRNLSLYIRRSEATGLERIYLESFMKTNSKLETRNGYNVDETGLYTVQVLIKLLLQNERTK